MYGPYSKFIEFHPGDGLVCSSAPFVLIKHTSDNRSNGNLEHDSIDYDIILEELERRVAKRSDSPQ
jgi:hypothetical protein